MPVSNGHIIAHPHTRGLKNTVEQGVKGCKTRGPVSAVRQSLLKANNKKNGTESRAAVQGGIDLGEAGGKVGYKYD